MVFNANIHRLEVTQQHLKHTVSITFKQINLFKYKGNVWMHIIIIYIEYNIWKYMKFTKWNFQALTNKVIKVIIAFVLLSKTELK